MRTWFICCIEVLAVNPREDSITMPKFGTLTRLMIFIWAGVTVYFFKGWGGSDPFSSPTFRNTCVTTQGVFSVRHLRYPWCEWSRWHDRSSKETNEKKCRRRGRGRVEGLNVFQRVGSMNPFVEQMISFCSFWKIWGVWDEVGWVFSNYFWWDGNCSAACGEAIW